IRGVLGDSRDEDAVATRDDALCDLGDLLRRLPRPVHDLRESLPERAMMIDGREAERLGRLEGQRVERARDVERTVRHLLEQVADGRPPHAAVSMASASGESSPPMASEASATNVSRRRRYSSKMPSTSSREFTAWSFLRSSADAGSPFTYQPRCLRNSRAAP